MAWQAVWGVNTWLRQIEPRTAFALLISLLLHMLLFMLPAIKLPDKAPSLPVLEARLEPLSAAPTAVVASSTPISLPTRALRQNQNPVQQTGAPEVSLDEEVALSHDTAGAEAGEAVAVASAPVPAIPQAEAEPASAVTPASTVDAISPAPPPLPKHAWLRYDVSLGEETFKIGEAIYTLDISDGRYELRAEIQSTGLANMLTRYRLSQRSSGRTDGVRLFPEHFSETAHEFGELKTFHVTFDYAHQRIHFSHGKDVPLPDPVQDILSILYQFPGADLNSEIVSVALVSSHDVEQHDFAVSALTELDTPLGKVHTLYLDKMRENGTPGLGIWFAREYRWLPVKVRHIGSQGNTRATAIIREIRVADE